MEIVAGVSTKVTTGTVDFNGEIADKRYTGGRRASSFIICINLPSYIECLIISINSGFVI